MRDKNKDMKSIFGPYIGVALPLQILGLIFYFGAFMIDIFDNMFFKTIGLLLLTVGCLVFIKSMKRIN